MRPPLSLHAIWPAFSLAGYAACAALAYFQAEIWDTHVLYCAADQYLVNKTSSTLAAALQVGTPVLTEGRWAGLQCMQ